MVWSQVIARVLLGPAVHVRLHGCFILQPLLHGQPTKAVQGCDPIRRRQMDGSEVRSEDGRPCHQESQGRVAQGADVGHVAWFCPIDPNRNHSEDCFYVPKCAACVPLPAQPLERRGSRAAVARDESVDCAVPQWSKPKVCANKVCSRPKISNGCSNVCRSMQWM